MKALNSAVGVAGLIIVTFVVSAKCVTRSERVICSLHIFSSCLSLLVYCLSCSQHSRRRVPDAKFTFAPRERGKHRREKKKDRPHARAECFTFFASALNATAATAAGGRGVNALLLAHDKIKGTKGNWARGRGREAAE